MISGNLIWKHGWDMTPPGPRAALRIMAQVYRARAANFTEKSKKAYAKGGKHHQSAKTYSDLSRRLIAAASDLEAFADELPADRGGK